MTDGGSEKRMPRAMKYLLVVLATLGLLAEAYPVVAAPEHPAGAKPSSTLESATETRGRVYAHLMRAQLAQRRGQYRSAAAEVRRAAELQPHDAEVLIEGAEPFQRMGRLQDAEEFARRALALEPQGKRPLRTVADLVAARASGTERADDASRDEAIELYLRLVTAGDRDEELLRRLITLRLQAEDREGALDAARLLVEQRPGDRHASGLLAQLLMDNGRPQDALRVLLRFIATHPDDSPLIRLAEELARELGAWDVVEQVFADHADFRGRPVEAQRLRGEALLRLNRMEPASRALEQVLLTDPSDRAVRYQLARTYRSIGRLGEASRIARELADDAPADRGTHLLLAEILDDQGESEGALNAYNNALRLFSTGTEDDERSIQVREVLRRRMTLLYLLNGQQVAAQRMYDSFELPDEPEAQHVRARLAIGGGDWEEARQAARRLRLAGEVGAAAMVEGEVLVRSGRLARAEPKFAEAIADLGPASRGRVAELYLEVERPAPGETLLRQWVSAEPANADARFQLGSFLYRTDRLAEAEIELRAAFELDPRHSHALNYLGYAMAESGENLTEALELIQRALGLDPWNGAYLDSLGWVYYRMGRYAEAREPLEQAARSFPKDPTVLEHLGDLYARTGEREKAVAAWDRAIEAGAANAAALRVKIAVIEVAKDDEMSAPLDPQVAPE